MVRRVVKTTLRIARPPEPVAKSDPSVNMDNRTRQELSHDRRTQDRRHTYLEPLVQDITPGRPFAQFFSILLVIVNEHDQWYVERRRLTRRHEVLDVTTLACCETEFQAVGRRGALVTGLVSNGNWTVKRWCVLGQNPCASEEQCNSMVTNSNGLTRLCDLF